MQTDSEREAGLFAGFEAHDIPTARGAMRALVGGSGSPLLLLHGYPQSHVMWHAVAPLLAERHTVVATDLAGYGASFRPVPTADHAPHGKRAMAGDHVEVMAALGFDHFSVAGHDRGGRVAYRMALDHPKRVKRLAVLDIVPTAEVWSRADARFAQIYWHWGFLALPSTLPEILIGADPEAFFDLAICAGMGLGAEPDRYPRAILDAYRSAFDDASAIEAMCEDYRAGASVDAADDDADRALGRRIACPVLVLWGARGALPRLYDDVLAVWRSWAADIRGEVVDAGHFLAEDRPAEVAAQLLAFFDGKS